MATKASVERELQAKSVSICFLSASVEVRCSAR